MNDVTRPEALPGVLQEIARLTSIEVAIAIARWRGGRRLYIPLEAGLKHDHDLVKAIGRSPALRIVRHFGKGEIAVPNAKPYLNWLDARRLRREGLSVAQISVKLNLGQRRVQALVAGVEPLAGSADVKGAGRCVVCGHKHRSGSAHPSPDPRQFTLPLK
jgi:hypothetical protein